VSIDQALRRLYLTDGPTFVLRPVAVVAAVAAALGRNPSPSLGRVVRRAVQRMGARRVVARKPLVSGLRPRGVPRQVALAASVELRRFLKDRWPQTRRSSAPSPAPGGPG
jgi:hypothetical protein